MVRKCGAARRASCVSVRGSILAIIRRRSSSQPAYTLASEMAPSLVSIGSPLSTLGGCFRGSPGGNCPTANCSNAGGRCA
jgi:hypothetical protein